MENDRNNPYENTIDDTDQTLFTSGKAKKHNKQNDWNTSTKVAVDPHGGNGVYKRIGTAPQP